MHREQRQRNNRESAPQLPGMPCLFSQFAPKAHLHIISQTESYHRPPATPPLGEACFLAMSCNIHMNELPLIDAAYPHRTRREHTSLACRSLTMQHKLALNIEAELEDDTDRGYLFVLHIVQFISRTKYISITNCQLNLHCSWINLRRQLQLQKA